MEVKCIYNSLDQLNYQYAKLLTSIVQSDGIFTDLEIGKIYDVLALEYQDDIGLVVYIRTVAGTWFPTPYPIGLFKLENNEIMPGWRFAVSYDSGKPLIKIMSFPDWVDTDHYYERLVEGDRHATSAFGRWSSS